MIPPPHDPGQAPMNISKMKKKRVSLAILPNDKVLNPAVRALTAWKNAPKARLGMENDRLFVEIEHTKKVKDRVEEFKTASHQIEEITRNKTKKTALPCERL